jgi:hypothetical protein
LKAQYVRLFSDAAGNSHFQDCEAELLETEFAPGIPPLLVSSAVDANQVSFFAAPAGWQSSWHPSSARNLFTVIGGEWEIKVSDGEVRRFSGGAVVLVDDTWGTGHASKVISKEDSLSLLVRLPESIPPQS